MKRKVLGFLFVFAGCAAAFAGEHVDALVAKREDLTILLVGSVKEESNDSLMLKEAQHCIRVLEQVANDGGNFDINSWKSWAKYLAQVLAYATMAENPGFVGEAWTAANQLQQMLNAMNLDDVNAELVAENMLPLVNAMAEYAEAPGDMNGVMTELEGFQAWLTGLLPEDEEEAVKEDDEEEEEVKKDEDVFGDDFGEDLAARLANFGTGQNDEEEEEVDWGDVELPAGDDDDGDAVNAVDAPNNSTRVTYVNSGGGRPSFGPICTMYFDSRVSPDSLL